MYQRPPLILLLWTTLFVAAILAPACAGGQQADEPVSTMDSTRSWSATGDIGAGVGPDAATAVDVTDHEDTVPVTDAGGAADAEGGRLDVARVGVAREAQGAAGDLENRDF